MGACNSCHDTEDHDGGISSSLEHAKVFSDEFDAALKLPEAVTGAGQEGGGNPSGNGDGCEPTSRGSIRISTSNHRCSSKGSVDSRRNSLSKESSDDSVRAIQIKKFARHEGFFAALDQSVSVCDATTNFKLYGIDDSTKLTEAEVEEKVHAFRSRIITHAKFNGARAIGCVITEKALDRTIHDIECAKYLWTKKHIIPILRYGVGLQAEKNGVQLMKVNMMMLDVVLAKAYQSDVFGVKVRAVIRLPNAVGIKGVVDQLFQVAQRIADKNLVPIVQPEIDIRSPDKIKCEQVLIDVLIDALDRLSSNVKVALVLTLPTNPNLYLPLTKHNRILRVAALSGGYDRSAACKMLKQNVGIVASFARGLSEDLSLHQEEEDFAHNLDATCQALFEASHSVDDAEEQLARMADHAGFVVAITPRAVTAMLTEEQLASPDADAHKDACFKRVVTSDKFNSARVIAVIIPMQFVMAEIDGMAATRYLWKVKGVVSLTIFSTILECAENGVQLTKVPSDCSEMLDNAVKFGVFGVQLRGMIHDPNPHGIESLVRQHFNLGKNLMARGLMPNMLLEVSLDCQEKARCEEILLNTVLAELGNLTQYQKITLALAVPSKTNLYMPLIQHPNVVRVGAPSGGNSCLDACRILSENVGMIGFFGRAFAEALQLDQSDDEFENSLAETSKIIHQATVAVSAKEEQMKKISDGNGFFAILDNTGSAVQKALKRYGIDADKMATQKEAQKKMQQMITRIVTNDKFNGSRVIGTALSEDSIESSISGLPAAKYLWSQKGTVPFLKLDQGLHPEANGVQLMKFESDNLQLLGSLLDRAASAGFFGTKARSFIKIANEQGIRALVDQQIEMARYVCTKGLLPMIQPEIDIESPQKAQCETILLQAIFDGIEKLRSDEKIVLLLTLPSKQNLYLPLLGHPNVLRLVALSGGFNRKESCKMLKGNLNMIAGFGRAFVEGMIVKQKDSEFTKVLDQSCNAAMSCSKVASVRDEQVTKLKIQKGFFVGFDQDANSMSKLLKAYGIAEEHYSDEAIMMQLAHALHTRVMTNPQFNGSRCIGVILTEAALALTVARLPPAKYLWEVMRIVPFVKIDKGLAVEEDGVRLMKDIKDLDQRLEKAHAGGIFGTIARSVIRLPSTAGIRSIVNQQVDVARQVLQKGLVPILQIEVDIKSPDKGKCELLLVNALCRGLDGFTADQQVILDVSLPNHPMTYDRLVKHANVIRVAALSGGYNRKDACKMLEQNVGMIASFGRAFTEGLHVSQTEKEFTNQIVEVCKLLYDSSRLVDEAEQPPFKVLASDDVDKAMDDEKYLGA